MPTQKKIKGKEEADIAAKEVKSRDGGEPKKSVKIGRNWIPGTEKRSTNWAGQGSLRKAASTLIIQMRTEKIGLKYSYTLERCLGFGFPECSCR